GDDRAVRVHTELGEHGVLVLVEGRARLPELGVDAVEHDVDAVGLDARVRLEDGVLHAGGDGDDGVGVLHGVLLGPGGDLVAAGQLLTLPRAVRLEGVGGGDVRDAVQLAGEVAAETGVPGVGVDDVDVVGGLGHAQSGGQRPDGGVGVLECRVDAVDVHPLHVTWGAHAVDVHLRDLAHETGQLGDVHTGAAVDLRGVLS